MSNPYIEPPPPPALSIRDSLHSSRQNLLHTAFPPFSSPSLPHLQHPPHRITQFATTNVTIGPHSFTGTKFYLVDWTTPIPSHPNGSTSSAAPPPPVPAPAPAPPPKPSAAEAITPSLIQRLNAASLTDPALANLLRRAATGQATPEELGGLSKKIEQLRKEEDAERNPTPPAPTPAAARPSTPPVVLPHPALVMEFAESSPNRFLIPDHFLCVVLTPRTAVQTTPVSTVALLLSFFAFPPDRAVRGREREILATEGSIPPPPPVPIDMIIEGVKEGEKDKFMRASRLGRPRDNGLENWWKSTIASVPSRVHVVHHEEPKPVLPRLPSESTPMLSRTNSEAGTVPMKRGASGTPLSTGAGPAQKRGKTVVAAPPPPPPTRRMTARSGTTRSRSSTQPVNYRDDTPEPSPPPEDETAYLPRPNPPAPPTGSSSAARGGRNNPKLRGGGSATGSPAPASGATSSSAQGTPVAKIRKKPGPKPGWKQRRLAESLKAEAAGS